MVKAPCQCQDSNCDLMTQVLSCSFRTGFGHFRGSIQSRPIQVVRTLGDNFAVITPELLNSLKRLSSDSEPFKVPDHDDLFFS